MTFPFHPGASSFCDMVMPSKMQFLGLMLLQPMKARMREGTERSVQWAAVRIQRLVRREPEQEPVKKEITLIQRHVITKAGVTDLRPTAPRRRRGSS